eukprot:1246-Heterococcus_DN1.PRE.2
MQQMQSSCDAVSAWQLYTVAQQHAKTLLCTYVSACPLLCICVMPVIALKLRCLCTSNFESSKLPCKSAVSN